VTENDNCHCTGTTKVTVNVMRRNASEEESFELTSKNRHWGCKREMLGRLFQVLATATGKARKPTMDSRACS